MSVTAHTNIGGTGVRLSLPTPREAHEARAQQACCDAIDASRDADAQANRRDLPAGAGETLLQTPTLADRLRERPGVLDRFAEAKASEGAAPDGANRNDYGENPSHR